MSPSMKQRYIQAMNGLHRLCLWMCGLCIVVMASIIPWGVFTRYVLHSAASWPEPMAVLLVIILTFLSAALCYRDNLHIAVMTLPDALTGTPRVVLGWIVELCMIATSLFMLVWGVELVKTTWYQAIAEFPIVSAGLVYIPVPLGGAITTLFVVERLWTGALFASPSDEAITVSTE